MLLKLYNTLTRKKEVFRPIKKGEVGLYSCGPTVHWYAHIGNLRTYVFTDILKRTLEYNGFKVKHVMNITDVGHLTSDADVGEDKMTKGLKREGMEINLENMRKLGEIYTEKFLRDLRRLNIKKPSLMPRASDHIKEDIELIKRLEEKGFTYKTSDGIYFDTSKLKDYGKLAGLERNTREERFSRIGISSEKRNPRDFALWKFSQKIGWNSPWGRGFPGWHIECSVMSTKYLGQPFDIHTGGIDHIQVHHTNEIAQSEVAYNRKMANYWLHGAFLNLKEKRMGKSEGNIITLDNLIDEGYNPLAFRYLCLMAHYRSELKFSIDSLNSAQNTFNRLKEHVIEIKSNLNGEKDVEKMERYKQKFLSAINDDLNTPEALAVLWGVIRSNLNSKERLALILDFDRVFGLGLGKITGELEIPQKIKELVKKRESLRKEKKWVDADKLRNLIFEKGYVVEDGKGGPKIKKKS